MGLFIRSFPVSYNLVRQFMFYCHKVNFTSGPQLMIRIFLNIYCNGLSLKMRTVTILFRRLFGPKLIFGRI